MEWQITERDGDLEIRYGGELFGLLSAEDRAPRGRVGADRVGHAGAAGAHRAAHSCSWRRHAIGLRVRRFGNTRHMTLDLGRLLRAKNMIGSAAAAVPADASSARALTESYERLRRAIRELVDGEGLEEEFDQLFPEIEIADAPSAVTTRSSLQRSVQLEGEARRATALLQQLSGWLDGMIQEQTLEQQIQANAEAYARQQNRPPTGFAAPGD